MEHALSSTLMRKGASYSAFMVSVWHAACRMLVCQYALRLSVEAYLCS